MSSLDSCKAAAAEGVVTSRSEAFIETLYTPTRRQITSGNTPEALLLLSCRLCHDNLMLLAVSI